MRHAKGWKQDVMVILTRHDMFLACRDCWRPERYRRATKTTASGSPVSNHRLFEGRAFRNEARTAVIQLSTVRAQISPQLVGNSCSEGLRSSPTISVLCVIREVPVAIVLRSGFRSSAY